MTLKLKVEEDMIILKTKDLTRQALRRVLGSVTVGELGGRY